MSEEIEQSDSGQDGDRLKDQQTAAVIAASSFIIFSVVYWFFQIQSVRELLELAYG